MWVLNGLATDVLLYIREGKEGIVGRNQWGKQAHSKRTDEQCSAHLHMKGPRWKVFRAERGRVCVLTPNC